MRIEVGRELGEFTVGEPIAIAGTRTVYHARQRALDRESALKVYKRDSDDHAARFLREAKIASSLDHPYLAHVYAFGAEPDVLWMAMELVRGTTLADVLATQHGGRLPIGRIAPFVDALCEVVHSVHDQGIVHCDLKPDNIMVLSRAGRLLPKLLDLGLAKPIAAPYRAMSGTPLYMAPEQWTDGAAVGVRADVYALGAIVFEMLAGKPPFAGQSVAELARAHLHDPVPALPGDVPDGVDAIIARALAKQPDDRFASALELAAAIRTALGSRVSADALPRLDDALRAELAWMPQPIAEAIAMLEAAKNPHQARDAVWQIVRVVVRWCGVVAIAARSQLGARPTGDTTAVSDALRELGRREPSDRDWIALVRGLVMPFVELRDAYPVPELIDVVLADPFAAIVDAPDDAATTEESQRDRVAEMIPAVERMLRGVAFFAQYPIIVPRADRADVWLGARRGARAVIAISPGAHDGLVQLADVDGNPLVELAPLVQIAPPAPGAADEMFVFSGPGRIHGHGARMISEPHGFERHDDAVWTWFRRELLAVDRDSDATVDDAPYRGLAAFTEADTGAFFGRERATEAFVNQLRVQPIAVVVGPSGTGKSSFVRAGVIPALPAGWTAVVIRPGATPVNTFAARRGDARVIVIDQLEELFTLCDDVDERVRFATAVIAATDDGTTRVVMTVRDDFLARASELGPFRDRLVVTLLATPDDDDLLRTLVLPARQAGYDFEPGLAHDMVTAVRGQPGALALLSFTALELWSLRDRHFKRLTRSAYTAIGGVDGALAQHAEATLRAVSADDQPRVRDAFRHLVTAEGTRAVLLRDELDRVAGSASVVDRLIAARLLVSEDGRVEIIHEALLAAWPRLVEWRREDADGARLRGQLRAAARQWADRDRARGLLWRDDALDDYVRWRGRHPGDLPELDESFAQASVRDARRGRRIRRGLAGTAAVVLVAGVIGLSLLYRSSRDNADAAHSQLVESYVVEGQHYLLDGDYASALRPLARAYADGDRSLGLRLMLHRAMLMADQPVVAFHSAIVDPVFRAPGELVAVGFDGDALAIDTTGRALGRLAAPAEPDERYGRATATSGRVTVAARTASVVVWDGTSSRTISTPDLDPATTQLALDDAGARLAIATGRSVLAIDVASGRQSWSGELAAPAKQVRWLGDALIVATRDKQVWRVDPAGARVLATKSRRERPLIDAGPTRVAVVGQDVVVLHDAAGAVVASFALSKALSAAVSRDGTRIALGNEHGLIAIDDIATGVRKAVLVGHANIWVRCLQFTPDGARLVSAADDETVRVWDVPGQHELVHYVGLRSTPTGLAISPDGTHIAVATGPDVRVFPIDDPSARLVINVGEKVGISQFVGTGERIFTGSDTGVELWDARTGKRLARIDADMNDGCHVDASGSLAAITIDNSKKVELRALPGGDPRGVLTSTAQIFSASFDPAGTRIVTTNQLGDVEIWTLDSKRVAVFHGHTMLSFTAAFSPDGTRVVSASSDRTVRVWDIATGAQIGPAARHADDVYAATFDATGTRVVTASNDATVAIWDARTMVQLAAFTHRAPVRNVAIDANGTVLAAVTTAGAVDVWDIAAGRQVVEFHHGRNVVGVDFSAERLLTTSEDGRAIVWDVSGAVPDPVEVDRFVACHVSRDGGLVSRDRSRCP